MSNERDDVVEKLPKGAVIPVDPEITSDSFDRAHGEDDPDIMWEMARQAYGSDYPDQVQPFGMTTWWTLGRFVSGLQLEPGQTLLDLACGRAGVGLWLARACDARLVGVDFSPVAIERATARAIEFIRPETARFVVGDLAATGVDTDSVDAAICTDAVFFAADRIAVFAELNRVLRPGGRFLFTADESDDDRASAVPDWAPLIESGGLLVERREEIAGWREGLTRLYDTWMARIDEVRAQLGDEAADELIDEAGHVGPTLPGRTGVLYTARKPAS